MAWYKDAALLQLEKLSRFQLLEDGSLQISGLLPDDTGMFQCFARNAAGEVQTTTYLAVTSRCQPPSALGVPLDESHKGLRKIWVRQGTGREFRGICASLCPTGIAPNITRGPQDSTVIDGMAVILNCETSGAPRPAITWQKGKGLGTSLSSEPCPGLAVALTGLCRVPRGAGPGQWLRAAAALHPAGVGQSPGEPRTPARCWHLHLPGHQLPRCGRGLC